jgi:hypothetical protein
LLTIDTSNPQAAYVGNPYLFGGPAGSPPVDYAETDLGYVGCQNKFLLKIPNGQITIDAKRGQIFLIQGTQATDISGFGSGLNRFFTDHLAFEILRYFPTVDTDNHFKNIGLHGVFDSKFERIIITKLDYIPQPTKEVFYDEVAKQFYVNQPVAGDLVVKKYVEVTDLEYFCNKSWTASFNFNTKSWVSFHTYLPNFYIGENNFFYSGLNEGCDVTAIAVVEIPSPTTTTTTTRIIYCNLTGTAVVTGYTSCILEGTASEQTTTTTTSTSTSTTTSTSTSTSTSTTTSTSTSTTTSTSSTTSTTTTLAPPFISLSTSAVCSSDPCFTLGTTSWPCSGRVAVNVTNPPSPYTIEITYYNTPSGGSSYADLVYVFGLPYVDLSFDSSGTQLGVTGTIKDGSGTVVATSVTQIYAPNSTFNSGLSPCPVPDPS